MLRDTIVIVVQIGQIITTKHSNKDACSQKLFYCWLSGTIWEEKLRHL